MIKSYIKLTIALFVTLFVFAENANAQDIHFSQFYASPLTLNPAMTGQLNGAYRISANYRSQYSQFNGYETIGASFDMPILRTALGSDHVGVGLQIFNDQAGDGNLNNISLLGSIAYHKSLDREGKFYFSVGAQGGYVQKSIDFTQLCFGQQITDNGCDETMPNNEPINDNSFGYLDVNFGGLFSGRFSDYVSAYAGGSYHHATEPIETFLGSDNRRGARIVGHIGAEIFLNKQVSLSPSAIYMSQTGAQELNIGTAVGYHFAQNSRSNFRTALFIGSWYRTSGELVVLGGIDYNDFRFGISYDIVPSNFSPINSSQGGFELSVQYIGNLFDARKKYPLLYCPRF